MPANIIVTVKQVIDPEIPLSAFKLSENAKRVEAPSGIPPVVNGFDENAVEAALRIRDTQGGTVTVISMGKEFSLDVIKKPLAMGVDELILLEDDAFVNDIDSYFTAYVLSMAIQKLDYDLIICGRQASDWDNAQVPLGIAEILGIPCITLGRDVNASDGKVTVERNIPDGYEVLEASLPALITVSNELGQPRYPTLRGIMAATRRRPVVWTIDDLHLDGSQKKQRVELVNMFVPTTDKQCQFIQGEDDAEAGRKLALALREAKLI